MRFGELVSRYSANADRIQLGMIIWLAVFPFAMQMTMTAALASLIEKNGWRGASLRYLFLGSGILLGVPGFFMPSLFWSVITFYPERLHDLTQITSDVTWLSLITTIGGPCIQEALFGVIILRDKSDNPLFPRWSGFFSLWVSFLTIPTVLAILIDHGPMGWDGIIAFWLPIFIFGYYMMMMYYLIYSGVKKLNIANS